MSGPRVGGCLLLVCAVFALVSSRAVSAPVEKALKGSSIIISSHGFSGGALYRFVEDKDIDPHCVKIAHIGDEPAVYVLDGVWFHDGRMESLCDGAVGGVLAMKKGDTGVFCASTCSIVEHSEKPSVFLGSVIPIEFWLRDISENLFGRDRQP